MLATCFGISVLPHWFDVRFKVTFMFLEFYSGYPDGGFCYELKTETWSQYCKQ